MSGELLDSPLPERPARDPAPGRGFTITKLLVVVAVIALLIGLLLPARRSAGPAVRRTVCASNLRQIGLALDNYEQDQGVYPPARTFDANGRPLHSWRTLILPYMDHS